MSCVGAIMVGLSGEASHIDGVALATQKNK
jgi:hypothetical protein